MSEIYLLLEEVIYFIFRLFPSLAVASLGTPPGQDSAPSAGGNIMPSRYSGGGDDIYLFVTTRRYSPLRGLTSSSCGGLRPPAEAFLTFQAKKMNNFFS